MRTSVLALALTTVGALVGGTNAAAEPASQCKWAASQVVAPEGFEAKKVRVEGTDSHGNYVGTVYITGTMDSKVVVWTGGQPRLATELGDVDFPGIVDENSSGTVLLEATFPAEGRRKLVLLSGVHTGNGTVTELTAPAGYRDVRGMALNERGDALAYATSDDGRRTVSIVYRGLGAEPVVIETVPGALGRDLDDDGTVLIVQNMGKAQLWRDGQLTPLNTPDGTQPFFVGIRSGKVIGSYNTTWPNSQALLWDMPSTFSKIKEGNTPKGINSHGLIVGSRGSHGGPAGVWYRTKFLGELPMTDNVKSVEDMVIGDDNSIFGSHYAQGALRWTNTCADVTK